MGILNVVHYRTREEEGTQTPLETLAKARGSCRDIAALFIDAARQLGLGARAVSGYLYDPGAQIGDHGSTHAWAEVYLPCAGWIAFDPTHRRMGSPGLIPVAVARCNDQTTPVDGGYVGEPEDFIGMDVSVSVSQTDLPITWRTMIRCQSLGVGGLGQEFCLRNRAEAERRQTRDFRCRTTPRSSRRSSWGWCSRSSAGSSPAS